jgi:hypothetical protein
MASSFTVSQVKDRITCKDDFYDVLKRNQFFLPEDSSSFITEEYLTDQWRVALEKFITHYVWHSQDRR